MENEETWTELLIDWTTQTFMNDMIWQKNNSCDSHIDCYDNIARVVTVSQQCKV